MSPSISPSTSPSVSPSISLSMAPTTSLSISPSISPSTSPSISVSLAPSISPSTSLGRPTSSASTVYLGLELCGRLGGLHLSNAFVVFNLDVSPKHSTRLSTGLDRSSRPRALRLPRRLPSLRLFRPLWPQHRSRVQQPVLQSASTANLGPRALRPLWQPPSLRLVPRPSLPLFRPVEHRCRPRALQPALRPSGVGLVLNIELGHCNGFDLWRPLRSRPRPRPRPPYIICLDRSSRPRAIRLFRPPQPRYQPRVQQRLSDRPRLLISASGFASTSAPSISSTRTSDSASSSATGPPTLYCLLSASIWPACAVGCRQNGS